MMNPTALIIAGDSGRTTQLVNHLSATGLFGEIRPIASIAALFRHLKSKSADMVCWTVDQRKPKGNWIHKLQAQEQWHDLPLIAFADDQQSLLDGFELGASDAIHLQIDPQELSARMQRHLQRWKRLCELRASQEDLQRLALTDPLTRIGNRATFDMSVKQTAARSQRCNSPYALLLIDLDHFKRVNDLYGHQAGDTILQKVANAIRTSARDADICCRYGGEEFVVILPDTTAKEAEILATRIHRQVAVMSRKLPPAQQPVTVSIGISSTARYHQISPAQLLEQADQALYRAKTNGRNRTEICYDNDNLEKSAPLNSYTAASQYAWGA